MIELRDKDTGKVVGSITEEQLQFLVAEFVEESDDDRDYWVDEASLVMLAEAGADDALIALLRKAMAGKDGVEIEWSRG